jgi:hypothetical protein
MNSEYEAGSGLFSSVRYGESYAVGAGTWGDPTSTLPIPGHRLVGTVKKKTLEFNALEVSYNYETRELNVVNASGQEVSFDEEELAELKAALVLLGIGFSGTGTEYR